MDCKLDLSREYGIVLEGGGARGSYQIGAWKALREAGIKIRGIAGASVGALNGALMCMDDLEHAEYIWENIRYSQVMDIDDQVMECVRKGDLKAIPISDVLSEAKRVLKDRGFDITPLRNLIDEVVNEEKIRSSARDLFVSAISISDWKSLIINMKDVPDGQMGDMLLASAYFPVFKSEKLGGKRYTDGGGANNVPVDVLANQGYQDLIVIRIYGPGLDTERFFTVPENVTLYHIAPRQSLGGILEFDRKKARKNMTLGYLDGKRLLYGLGGKRYYIYAPGSEAYYFDKMMSEIQIFSSYLEPEFKEYKLEDIGKYRICTEKIFPALAAREGLKGQWDYRDIYLLILETLARKLRISRFQVYTVEELLLKIHQKLRSLDRGLQI